MYLTKRVRANNSAFGRKHTFRIIGPRISKKEGQLLGGGETIDSLPSSTTWILSEE
jgi:hypothetical protein